ncbi:MAG: delta-60 repeat domain-containing protein, partial [Pseudonocardiaceae bacterium]
PKSLQIKKKGKIVAGGYTSATPSTVFALAPFNADVSLDRGFGRAGKATTDFGNAYDQANSLVLQPDGKIIAAGYTSATRTTFFALARYTTDGQADTTFGTHGRLTSFSDSHSYALQAALHPDGALIVAGFSHEADHTVFAVVRYALCSQPPPKASEVATGRTACSEGCSCSDRCSSRCCSTHRPRGTGPAALTGTSVTPPQ